MRRNAPPRAGAARFAGTSLAWAVLVLPPRTRRASIPHMPAEPYSETIPVPASVRFPVELEPPEGFRPEEPASWAQWYLAPGVPVVWLVLPKSRDVLVVTAGGESRHRPGERLPPHPALPGLEPAVERFFRQLDPPAS